MAETDWGDRRHRPPRDIFFDVDGIVEQQLLGDESFPSAWAYSIQINGLSKQRPPSERLLSAATKLVSRIGGDIEFDRNLLRDGGDLTELGAALIHYAALTTYLFDDPYLFKSGRLRTHGYELANELKLPPISEVLRPFRAKSEGESTLVRLSPIEEGSLTFKQLVLIVQFTGGIAATGAGITTMAARGPEAYDNYQNIYAPAIGAAVQDAVASTGDIVQGTGEYMNILFGELGKLLDVTVIPVGPKPTAPPQQSGVRDRRRRSQTVRVWRG